MGMFDTVHFDYIMPDGINGKCYQTKDLDCNLEDFIITEKGELIKSPTSECMWHNTPEYYEGYSGNIDIYRNFDKPIHMPKIYEGKIYKSHTYKKPTTWLEYTLLFENGFLKTIKSIYLDEVFEFS